MAMAYKIEYVKFRELIKDYPSTTYATFSIYRYPAKFIPQVIAYILKNYCKPNMTVFDPFAGYGTVGIVSRLFGYNYELWDLNPMLKVIHDTATMRPIEVDINKLIQELKNSNEIFIPKWSNLKYWHPEEFLDLLTKVWGYYHNLEDNELKKLLVIPLLKVTRYFSYSDEKIHKLYKSKYAKKKVEDLLKKDWKTLFFTMLFNEIRELLKKIEDYNSLRPKPVKYKIKAGIDTLNTKLDQDVDVLITSPPYLQAQEYIRSTKLELFWLGYSENYIRQLSKKEIPYANVRKIEVYSKTYEEIRSKIKDDHLLKLYDNYFFAILRAFTSLGENVKSYMCIFVGPAKVRGMPVPIDQIIVEHLKELGWRHEATLIDRIVSHSMFKVDVNPASGLKESRMETEHLVILRRE
jgi:DNA modification methylase